MIKNLVLMGFIVFSAQATASSSEIVRWHDTARGHKWVYLGTANFDEAAEQCVRYQEWDAVEPEAWEQVVIPEEITAKDENLFSSLSAFLMRIESDPTKLVVDCGDGLVCRAAWVQAPGPRANFRDLYDILLEDCPDGSKYCEDVQQHYEKFLRSQYMLGCTRNVGSQKFEKCQLLSALKDAQMPVVCHSLVD